MIEQHRDILQPATNMQVSILPITQATTATFIDLYFRLTFLFFIQTGSKKVICPYHGELIGEAGDLMIFPPGSMVTMENRPILNDHYRADGVSFTDDLVHTVFNDPQLNSSSRGIQVVRSDHFQQQPSQILGLIKNTLNNQELPLEIKQHRLLEPLIWLRQNGIQLSTQNQKQALNKVRQLLESDLSHSWRISEVAQHFAMSEATLRRWLAKTGNSFSHILLNTRLEKGLTLLQTTNLPISQIAVECGFKTPSYFSDSFKKRFKIKPKRIRSTED
ncbi:helix-turn-helix transcriptional regulator [Acinetobacter puyangensis]|uniref:helix-turn-helix transcriptional regulator n=1 Tax=Acinetobacter puyangensis TaxID=1096779 RepID=UPI003A4D93B3